MRNSVEKGAYELWRALKCALLLLWPRNHVATRSHDFRVTASEMRYLSRDSKSVYLNIEHFDAQTSAYLYSTGYRQIPTIPAPH
jgi:hypothetical protein